MPNGQGPTTTRRRLRAELRRLRLAKGLSVDAVTAKVEWSSSKLIRIEGGQVGISVSDLNALLEEYAVTDKARVEQLRVLARASRQRTWWSQFQRYLPASYQEFIGAESDAAKIWHYHPSVVPGLLQTPEYASAVIQAVAFTELDPDVLRVLTEVRRLRRKHVLEGARPPKYMALVDEATLRRPVGGSKVMLGQLDYLLDIASRKNVTLVLVPFSAGVHPGVSGAFAVMDYDDEKDAGVVCLETPEGDFVMQDQPEQVESYRRAAERLAAKGLRGAQATSFIREVRDSLYGDL